MKKKSKTLQPNKINRKIYQIRLAHNLKKVTDAELNITMVCVAQEIERRKKQKGKK